MKSYDVLIVGGGMVGASLVQALAGQGLRLAVIEAVPFETRSEPGYDDRAIALAHGTQKIFRGLGLWDALSVEATPIHRIHVSDRGHYGFTRMDRSEEGLPALGYVVPARLITRVLGQVIQEPGTLDLYCPAVLSELTFDDNGATARVSIGSVEQEIAARLVVAADGAGSAIRDQLGIPVKIHDYGQVAVVTNITPQLPHNNIAYERFTETGPLAILPMSGQRCAVVWTVEAGDSDAVTALSDTEFLARLQDRFGYRLGRLEQVGRRQAWPLRLIKAQESVRPRLALVGNAAHTLHPIAGQGLNLGVRDVAVLAEVIVDAVRADRDPGDLAVLSRYGSWRQGDHRRVTAFTDGMARMFTLPLPAFGAVRSAGMVALDLLPPAKRLLTRLTMGRGGPVPRLARGLPL
ncbi:MAG: 2-octaprenyl-6-methoxyphenyl hydroxylase [Gammaproteobacteria bacterium]|nr:MAG: 2-octaprenyl-6-methoxyphenyl hydroxylase [Gammaproteobacteria bacterium]